MEDWKAFERKLNTVDRERERRAQAFLHEMDDLVTVREAENHTEIDIPWLEDNALLALLGEPRKQSQVTFSTHLNRANNCYVEGYQINGYIAIARSEVLLVA